MKRPPIYRTGFFAGLVCLSLSACTTTNFIPSDYVPIYSPVINGKLLLNGQPVSDTEIVLAPVSGEAAQCYFEKRSVRTDENGQFSLSALTASEAGDWALENEYRWQVCVKDASGKRSIWYDSITGRLSPNASVNLICDLRDASQGGSLCQRSDSDSEN